MSPSTATRPVAGPVPSPVCLLPPDDEAWRHQVRDLARTAVAPRVAAMDRAARLDDAVLAELAAAGLLGIRVPEVYGGAGRDLFAVVLAVEELAAVDPAVAVVVDVQNALLLTALHEHGTGDQRRRWLPAMAAGTLGAFALSEAGSGSDAFALATTAEDVDGGWVLTGAKAWTTNAAEAGLFLVSARIPDRGTTAFLVPAGADGLRVGDRHAKMGIRASSTCDLELDGVRVGRADVLGAPGCGEQVVTRTLEVGKLGIAAQLVGLASGALERAAGYAAARRQFGHPIGSYQGIRFPLARLHAELTAARTVLYDSTRLAQTDPDPRALTAAAAISKYLASQVAESAASFAVEVLGGFGYTEAGGVEKLYRDAKVGTIYEGTTNMQLRTLAAGLLRGTEAADR